jgi:hypothetical protein
VTTIKVQALGNRWSSPMTSLNLVPAERRDWLLLGGSLLFEFEPGIDLGVAYEP